MVCLDNFRHHLQTIERTKKNNRLKYRISDRELKERIYIYIYLYQNINLWSQPAVAAILLSTRIEVPAMPGLSKLISFLTKQEPYTKEQTLQLSAQN